MKKILICISLLSLFLLWVYALAQTNYLNAVNAATKSEGTDSAIEDAMKEYGFNVSWDEKITLRDKVTALFN